MKEKNKPSWREETKLCHDGDFYFQHHGAIVPPIYQNSLFAFENWDAIDDAFSDISNKFVYSRLLNPTVQLAEEKIATLCKGEKAKLCASGMGAISSAILHYVKAGDHMITIKNVYGPANSFIGKYLPEKCGVSATYVKGIDVGEFEEAIQDNTALIYLESPASLTYEIQDLKAIAEIAKLKGIKTVIDNTWASPIFQKPLEMGIDMEVHSVSKYICGHSDVVAGVIIGQKKDLDKIIIREHGWLGAKMAPFEGWLILRSLRTLPLRMRAHQENSFWLSAKLESHPAIKRVIYPGSRSFSQYELASQQMSGFGGLLSIELNTNDLEKVKQFVNALSLFKLGVSWGGHESLVYAPAISYAKELDAKQFAAMGISVSLIRLSIGLEHYEDLWEDLNMALGFIE